MPRPPVAAPAPASPAVLRRAVLAILVLAATVLAGSPAGAHPFLRDGGEVPVDSLATVTLDLAHGCGSEAEGTGEDTLEVALEVPPWLRVVAVADQPIALAPPRGGDRRGRTVGRPRSGLRAGSGVSRRAGGRGG